MIKIVGMTGTEITKIDPKSVKRILSFDEIMYIAMALGAFWQYDYFAGYSKRRWGYHAELKSGRHSDSFFDAKIMLSFPSIKTLLARQMVLRLRRLDTIRPDWVAGVPNGATEFTKEIARITELEFIELVKDNNHIVSPQRLGRGNLLLFEDVCSSGTGFREAVSAIKLKSPNVRLLPIEPVILNRGWAKRIFIEEEHENFKIVALIKCPMREWEPQECPLCEQGSKAIKPKETNENWRLITTSQSSKREL
jgi:orotate phosphoribosyltransferase